MEEFVVFTVITVKMYIIPVDSAGSLVFKNHMYAVIHYIITEVRTLSDDSSKFNDVISNFHRLERSSCLGSALHQACFLEFPFLVKRKATCLLLKKLLDEYDVFRHNTTFSDKYDVVRRIRRRPTSFLSKKPLNLLHFCLETLAFQSIKKLGTFFQLENSS